jgi:hypothetical protein
MNMTTETIKTKVWTDQEFIPNDCDEITDGELVMGNSGMEHGNIGIFLGLGR